MGVVNSMARHPHCVFGRSQIIILTELFSINAFHGLLFEEILVRSQSSLEFVNRVFFISKIVPLLIQSQNHFAVNIKCLPFDVL